MNDKIAKTMGRIKGEMSALKGIAALELERLGQRKKVVLAGVLAGLVGIGCCVPFMLNDDNKIDMAMIAGASGQSEDAIQEEHDVHAIAINGKRIVYVATKADAEAVLEQITTRYTEKGSEIKDVQFKESVEIVKADDYISAERAAIDETVVETYLCQVYEAAEYILTGTSTPKTYTVKGGDTLWDIANANNISPYELADMNPGINVDRLSIGDVINLYEVEPYVTVTTIEVATETERIPYEVEYTETADLYKGQTQVTSAGSYGSKEKQIEYIKENGIIVASTVLSEEILTEPVKQYALVGTTTMPIKTGSGSLAAPLGSVKLSSSAGKYGASRGSRTHVGVDLKGAKGDPIYASDGGTVIFSGYSGSYGYLIKVDHGNGIETRYSHCDSLLVSYGDDVEKGQIIGTVGRTGNATGYLLHFEVRINGSPVNPLNYL